MHHLLISDMHTDKALFARSGRRRVLVECVVDEQKCRSQGVFILQAQTLNDSRFPQSLHMALFDRSPPV